MDNIVSKTQFAAALGITPGRVSQLIKAGLPVRADGKLDLAAASAWYRQRVARPASKPVVRMPGDDSLAEARRRREWIRLAREQLLLEKVRGEVVDVSDVEAAAFERGRAERDALLNFPSRVAPIIAAEFEIDSRKLFLSLKKQVRLFLSERSEYPPGSLLSPKPQLTG